jgi:stage VI sporulation protein D
MSQSKLRFSIEESVWLKKGQEVAEVLSMSLVPEISVTEEAGQVYIKGALILNGKYCTEQSEDKQEQVEENPLLEGTSYRSLTQLNVTEDGVTELVHRFPVDITIPSYRVEDSRQVKVEVESFEYELPNSTCFELSASICICGIKDETQRLGNIEAEEKEEIVRSAQSEEETTEIFTPFQFEARQSNVDSSPQNEWQNHSEEAVVRSDQKTHYEFKPHYEVVDDKAMEATFDSLKSIAYSGEPVSNETGNGKMDDVEGDESLEYQASLEQAKEQGSVQYQAPSEEVISPPGQSYEQLNNHQFSHHGYQHGAYQHPNPFAQQAPPFGVHNQYQQEARHYSEFNREGYGEISYHSRPDEEDFTYNPAEVEAEAAYDSRDEQIDEVVDAELENNEQTEEQRDENALYLTKMLSAKEENFSKVKMYILQRGDSLEHICERYDITLNSLMRMNRIQQEEVTEGQIIYIPVSSR